MADETPDTKQLAYDAGRQAITEPPERRGVEGCPFSPIDHPEERAEWLRGLAEALDAEGDLRAALADARKELDDA